MTPGFRNLRGRVSTRRVLLGGALLAATGLAVFGPTGVLRLVRDLQHQIDSLDKDSCVGCHARLHPVMVHETRVSPHYLAGVTCEDCHGSDHEAMFRQDGEVSPVACAEVCHAEEYTSFMASKHSRPKTGPKAEMLLMRPRETGSCSFTTGCHMVRKTFPDGSSGKCSVCHPSHSFSLDVARDPAVCVTCHSGSNNTEVVEYEKSIHGVLYRTGGTAVGGPTCVTCHMPGGRHDEGFNLTDVVLGPGDGPLHFVHTMAADTFTVKREAMLTICRDCHATKLPRRALKEADDFRKEGAFMLEQASAMVHGLYEKGIMDPMPDERSPNPLVGPEFYLGPNQLFDRDMSKAERIFYRMYMFTYSAAWRRGYHNLPGLSRWHENEMLKEDLIMLRAEVRRLEALAEAGVIIPRPPGAKETAGVPTASPIARADPGR